MKTTTAINLNGPVKMVDATYKVTVELNFSETTLLQGALEAYLVTYSKLKTENNINESSELFSAIESITASLKQGIAAFNVQKLIEGGKLSIGRNFHQV